MPIKKSGTSLLIKLGKNKQNLPADTPIEGDFKSLEIIAPDLEKIALDLEGFPKLESFSLIGGSGIIPNDFWKGRKIKNLKITKGNWQLPLKPGLDLNSLEKLNLGGLGLVECPSWVPLCKSLKELDLSSNQLSDLPLALANLENLTRLNLDYNVFEKVPVALTRMPGLIHLSLDRNPFDPEEVDLIKNIFGIWW